MNKDQALNIAIQTLKELIRIPSISGNEAEAADCIQKVLANQGLLASRKNNNVWSVRTF
jgi:acetylornithine deacetylase/succinyl-diaminopimelate desuccinylase-like protein